MALQRSILAKDEALKRIQQQTGKPNLTASQRKQLFNLYQNINNAKTMTYEISSLVEALCPRN